MDTGKKRPELGVLGAVGVSLTAGFALPLVKVLEDDFATGELMIGRGVMAMLVVVMFLYKRVGWPGWLVITYSTLFAFANLCLYRGVVTWGANPTIVILTTTPVINFVAKLLRREMVSGVAALSLFFMLVGVVVALEPWEVAMDAEGLAWSVAATVFAGLGFEIIGMVKDVDSYNETFWLALIIALVGTGYMSIGGEPWQGLLSLDGRSVLILSMFGLLHGFLYLYAIIVTFDYLKTEVSSVLLMGETPVVIIVAWWLLGESMTVLQVSGAFVALVAASILGYTKAREKQETQSSP